MFQKIFTRDHEQGLKKGIKLSYNRSWCETYIPILYHRIIKLFKVEELIKYWNIFFTKESKLWFGTFFGQSSWSHRRILVGHWISKIGKKVVNQPLSNWLLKISCAFSVYTLCWHSWKSLYSPCGPIQRNDRWTNKDYWISASSNTACIWCMLI